MPEFNIADFDPAMAIKPADTQGIAWHLPFEKPFSLLGFNWFDVDHAYERLPIKGRPTTITQYANGGTVTIPAEKCGAINLSRDTAGGQIRFRTDSSQFLVEGELLEPYGMDHMAFTGSAGFDIYLKVNGVWKCFGVTRTDHSVKTFSTTIVSGLKREMRDVIINFPLYNGVKSLSVGLDENAAINAPTPFRDPRPVVFYGTSITQGGCATRPDMASSNILSRMLERYVLNLGFSGSGRGEPEIIQMLADIKNPAAYLIDHAWNNAYAEFAQSLPIIIDALRAKHPDTPIVLISPTPGRGDFDYYEVKNTRGAQQTELLKAETERRIANGDKNITFFDAFHDSLGDDYWEGLVDGCHMTDLGFYRFAKAILPHLQKILG